MALTDERVKEIRGILETDLRDDCNCPNCSAKRDLLADRDRLDGLYHTSIDMIGEYRIQRDRLAAKLATAVEALKEIDVHVSFSSPHRTKAIARAALDKIKKVA